MEVSYKLCDVPKSIPLVDLKLLIVVKNIKFWYVGVRIHKCLPA